MLRALVALLFIAAFAAAGSRIVPRAFDATALFEAADDPAALSDLRLRRELSAGRVADEIDAALAGDDPELAASFVALADEQGLPVAAERRARVDIANVKHPSRSVRDFAQGFAVGETETLPGFAGAIAGDVVGYGDLRDLVREGSRLARGEPSDELMLGLAAVGLVITGATWSSAGSFLPARAGVTAVKSARKAGRLSRPLAEGLARATHAAVDREALHTAAAAMRRLDLRAARKALATSIRPQALGKLTDFTDDAATLYRRTGHRGAQQALALADNGDELRRAAKLAGAKGSKTRAVLKALGRGALVLGGIASTLALWILAAIGYALAFAWMLTTMLVWFLRRLWPRRGSARRSTCEADHIEAKPTWSIPWPWTRPSGDSRPAAGILQGRPVVMIRSLSIRFAIFCTAVALYAMAGLAIANRQLTSQAVQVAAAVSVTR